MEQMMQSSEIGKIAQQVSESINMEELLGSGDSDNPMEMFQKLMSGDAMSKIMGSIHTAVNEKVESGELNKEDMVKEAQGIYGNLGDNPLFQGMNQQAQQQNRINPNNPHQSNKTRARLQKKLQQKKEANQSSNTD